MEISDGTHKINLVVPIQQGSKLSQDPKTGDIIAFVRYKTQVVSGKEALILLGDIELLCSDAIWDDSRVIVDYNVAKA